jgi:hypothetical protein
MVRARAMQANRRKSCAPHASIRPCRRVDRARPALLPPLALVTRSTCAHAAHWYAISAAPSKRWPMQRYVLWQADIRVVGVVAESVFEDLGLRTSICSWLKLTPVVPMEASAAMRAATGHRTRGATPGTWHRASSCAHMSCAVPASCHARLQETSPRGAGSAMRARKPSK